MPKTCPNCGVSLDGGSIWEHFYNEYRRKGPWVVDGVLNRLADEMSDEEAMIAADETAAMYGATRTKGNWGRQIGIYSWERDRIVAWKCPDCDHEWER